VHIVEIQRDRAKAAMDYAQERGENGGAFADAGSGCYKHDLARRAELGTVQEGDQVRSGPPVPFLQVVDPSQMEVRVEVNQVDSATSI